ncbi:MAG TPA: transglycosylase SLT domain-containing protein [Verrucomicrobiae bacterium]|nr:transglycosylase SLT domain-containing protein [Verrucomicrobiae bacterium]
MSIDPAASRLSAQGVAYAPAIAGAAQRHGLDPELLAAVAAQETGGPGANAGRNVVGDGGHGHGLFQIDDRYHTFAQSPQAMDPSANADYAAGMLSGLLQKYGGNVHDALSAYNAGSPQATGTTTTWSDGSTLGYADSVMRHYTQLTGGGSPSAPGNSGGTGGESDELEQSVVSELSTLVSSIGMLGAQAQSMPSMPQLPQPAQPQSYQRAATDYSGLFDDGDDA